MYYVELNIIIIVFVVDFSGESFNKVKLYMVCVRLDWVFISMKN